ncbi:MAG: pyridoxamine 5'-phosphate oxidase family protein [Rhodobacteraceae bacterium]|nr:pyridoxamine 5'-phosphate oxidase family protein [Paracoccaceae bacterium]
MPTPPPSDRVRLRRAHERGTYDAETLHPVLDATPLCSVGYVIDGQPYVTPTMHWREGDHLYWHGSSASRMLRAADSAQVCVTVSLLDGFVMARSGMHHSINYRSAMMLGTAHKITGAAEIEARLKIFVDGMFPGRWDMLRPANAQEIKATTLMTMPLDEASTKIRTGPPNDDEEDYELPIWAGVIPVRTQILPPEPDPRNLDGLEPPAHIVNFRL